MHVCSDVNSTEFNETYSQVKTVASISGNNTQNKQKKTQEFQDWLPVKPLNDQSCQDMKVISFLKNE